jgi:hypothetical protein
MAAVAKTIQAQRDFSAGEIDPAAKRADQAQDTNATLKAGLRQAANLRLLNSKSAQNRPGRRALQLITSRTEEITISPGLAFRFNFNASVGGTIIIYDVNGAIVASRDTLGWTAATIPFITWAVLGTTVYVAGPGFTPFIISWDGVLWSSASSFSVLTTAGGQKRTFFYRLSPQGVTMTPSATTGAITMAFSPAVAKFSAAMVGTLLRFCGRQIQVTGFTSTALLSGTVLESLPPGQTLTATFDPRTLFSLGDEIIGQTTGATGLVTALTATLITVQLLQQNVSQSNVGVIDRSGSGNTVTTIGFQSSEVVSGPGGSVALTAAAIITTTPQPVAVWDDEVMNSFRGWPASVFADQSRLGFCNFPALPQAIGWSAISAPTDCYVEALARSAMLELAPDKVQVFYVVPGPESSEFVFCDRRIYYIPISATNPLRPGSVAFQIVSGDGCAQVQPRAVQEVILYISAGSTSVMSIVAPGAYSRPYETRNLSELHGHLIRSPIGIAIPSASDQFEERYAYVLNSDGTIAVGKYSIENGQIKGPVGWVPWSGLGTVNWISARDAVLLFVTTYSGVSVLERIDNTLYLDAAVFVNVLPTALAKPAGKGPLWWLPGQSVDLMDQGTRMMGTYDIDANGNIIPQNNAGEDLTVATLVAGKAWTATLEPFVPAVQPGQDQLQRMRKRRITRAEIYVENSTGFRLDTLQAEQQGASLPTLGTAIRSRRIPAWNQDDDSTKAPPQRERAYAFKPVGRAHDPRIALVKDTPGPLLIGEFGLEVSV